MSDNFVSPMINSLSKLVKSDEYQALQQLYDSEEKILMQALISAQEDKDLRIVQGKAKMLKRLRILPEETIDRYINEKERKK